MSRTIAFPEPTMIRLDGVELEVFEAGSQHASNPIVLCHGFPELAYSWRHQVPALVAAGHHVLVPNQRGYGRSSRPTDVHAYGIGELAGDLVALLDHYGYERATFVGHDWGAMVVWGLALLHPERVGRIVNLALPYQERGERPWLEHLEQLMGSEHYLVHFHRQPGVADAILDANVRRFLRNLFRKDLPAGPPASGMAMIELARAEAAVGAPILGDEELDVYVAAFEATGFTASINWYRNLDRNWHTLAGVDPVVRQRTLMIHGQRDPIPEAEHLSRFVPDVDVVRLDCGHWIQQEMPAETNRVLVEWLGSS